MKQKKTLKGMMIKSIIIFVVVPFFLLWLSFAISSAIELTRNVKEEQETITRLLALSAENYFYELEESMGKVSSDATVLYILKNVDRSKYNSELYNANQHILKMIGKTCMGIPGVDLVAVADMNGGYYSTSGLSEEMLAYISDGDSLKKNIYDYQGKTWVRGVDSGTGHTQLMVVKPIMDMENAQFIGMMYLVIRTNKMDELLRKNMDKKEVLLLTDKDQNVIYAQNEASLQEAGMVVTESERNTYGISIVTGVSVLEYGHQLLGRQVLLLCAFTAATLFVLLLVQYIYYKLKLRT